jgi:Protein of unknown function, DUF481
MAPHPKLRYLKGMSILTHVPAARSLPSFTAVILAIAGSVMPPAHAQDKAPKPPPDVIVFNNGDQLTGVLERGVGNSVVFKSDVVGEVTVSLDKVKELHSSGSFAVLRKDVPVSRKTVTPGTVIFADGKLTVAPPIEAPQTIPSAQIAYIIDQPTYDKELEKKPGPFYGWNGAVNGGATVVRATDYGETFTAGIALIRAIPAVPFLPPRNRTTIDLLETYGKLTSPVIPQTTPPTPAAVTETSIFHADAERDEYFTPRVYGLVQTSFDHNFAQGLSLQQIYGLGVGWTVYKSPIQEFDVKADVHYERQAFQTPASNLNLIGSTFAEAYHRTLPHKLLFTENASILPAWNNSNAFSANAFASLAAPVYKRLSLVISGSDSFLNVPAVGYQKNSFQFITAISYTLK